MSAYEDDQLTDGEDHAVHTPASVFDHMDLNGGRQVNLIVADALPADVVEGPYDGMVVFAEVDQRPWEYHTRSGWRPLEPTDEELRTAHKRANFVEAERERHLDHYGQYPSMILSGLVEMACERIPGVVRPFQPTQFEGNSSQ